MLSTLEEISLHQQEIIKIENFDILCRHLRILYLQNNIIEKLENLNKLKELEYLNIALNNISVIENIEGCESLKKLDFTVNFIDAEDLEKSVQCLAKLPNLKEIYLTGNPCEDWVGCRDYVIAKVPLL
jgi:protein TilB